MVVKEVVKEGKRQPKTEVLSMRMDPKTRFFLDIVARTRRQSISAVVEQALQDAAENIRLPHHRTWQDYWDVQEGIRSLKMWADQHLFPTYEDEYKLEFTKTHWPFFYATDECETYLGWSIDVLWPKFDEFLSIWSKTKSSSNYYAAGNAMQQALRAVGLKAPEWPEKPKDKEPETNSRPRGGGPSWDAPKAGDLDERLPAGFLDELRTRTPLAALVGRRVRLARAGLQWKGCCPFHGEKTPSFYIYEDNHYHCFGCGAHGDAVRFVMQSEGAGFREAVERLAAEAGLKMPKLSAEAAAAERKRLDLAAVPDAAQTKETPLEGAKKPLTKVSGTSREGGPSGDATKGGDLDDEIPF